MRVALHFIAIVLAGARRGAARRGAQPRSHPLAAEAPARRRLQDIRGGDISSEYSSHASQLREDLFDGYDMFIPPSGGPEREAVCTLLQSSITRLAYQPCCCAWLLASA